MRNDPYFHVGYVPKIESGASHNIKFQKTKFSQKITSKKFFKVIFLEIHSCIHVFWPNSGNKFSFFSKIWQNLFENFISKILNFFEIFLSNFWKKSKIYYQFWTKKRVHVNGFPKNDFKKFLEVIFCENLVFWNFMLWEAPDLILGA